MKISRISEEKKAPEWVFAQKDEIEKSLKDVTSFVRDEDMKRLSSLPVSLDEDGLVNEREEIEKCASEGRSYFYASSWSEKDKKALKEYASIYDASERMIEIDADQLEELKSSRVVEAQSAVGGDEAYRQFFMDQLRNRLDSSGKQNLDELEEEQKRTLFEEIDKEWLAKDEVVAMLNDPFKLDSVGDDSHMKKANWEDIKKQLTISDKPSMEEGAVRPLRGGEDYNTNFPCCFCCFKSSVRIP